MNVCMVVEQHECVCALEEACMVYLGTCPPGKEGERENSQIGQLQ